MTVQPREYRLLLARVDRLTQENQRLRAEARVLFDQLDAVLGALRELQEAWHEAANLRAEEESQAVPVLSLVRRS